MSIDKAQTALKYLKEFERIAKEARSALDIPESAVTPTLNARFETQVSLLAERRAVAVLANRLETLVALEPLDADEIRDGLHEDNDLTDQEVIEVARFMSKLLGEMVESLDEVNATDRTLPHIQPHDLAGFAIR